MYMFNIHIVQYFDNRKCLINFKRSGHPAILICYTPEAVGNDKERLRNVFYTTHIQRVHTFECSYI